MTFLLLQPPPPSLERTAISRSKFFLPCILCLFLASCILSKGISTAAEEYAANPGKAQAASPDVPAESSGSHPAPPAESSYVLERGDVLSISVWQNQELTRTVTVLPDGNIIFPLTGAVTAAERTVGDFRKDMENRLRAYIPDLVLTVNVEQARSMTYFVIGKVNRPGEFPLPGNLTVLKALAVSGGLNEFAKPDRIKIFRQKGSGTDIIDFDYSRVSRGEDLTRNIILQRGDTLVIP